MSRRSEARRGLLLSCSHLATAAVLVTATGCQESSAPEPAWFGDRLTIATTQGAVPCAGTIIHYDRYIAGVEKFVGVVGDDRVEVVYADPDWFAEFAPCARGVKGCTDAHSGAVYIRQNDVLEHELVHAIITPTLGFTDHVLSEGLAEALGPTPGRRVPAVPESDPLEMLGLEAEEVDYGAAASFVSYLIRRDGVEKFMELYKRARPGRRDDTVALLEEIYGASLEALRQAFAQQGVHCPLTSFACSLTDYNWNVPESGARTEAPIGCEAWPAVGFAFPGPEQLYATDYQLSFQTSISASGRYLLETNDGLALSPCAACAPGLGVDLQNASTQTVQLDEGSYLTEVRANESRAHEWFADLSPRALREASGGE